MKRSQIGWTDFSGGYANFVVRGSKKGDCELLSGCRHCYVTRYFARSKEWPEFTTVYPEKLEQLSRCRPSPGNTPYRRGPGSKPMVFVCDTGDLFHHRVPDEFIFRALDVFAERDDIDWQVLTKRAQRARVIIATWLHERGRAVVPPSIWLVLSASNQSEVEESLPDFCTIPAHVLGVSLEPLLGHVTLKNVAHRYGPEPRPYSTLDLLAGKFVPAWVPATYTGEAPNTRWYRFGTMSILDYMRPLSWVIVGGESHHRKGYARPMPAHAPRVLLQECLATNTAFYFKAWGDYKPQDEQPFRAAGWDPEAYRGGDVLCGQQWHQWPM